MSVLPLVISAYIEGLKAHDVDKIATTVSDDLVFIAATRTIDKTLSGLALRPRPAGAPGGWHDCGQVAPRWHPHRDAGAARFRRRVAHWENDPDPGALLYKVAAEEIVEIRPDPVPGGAPRGIFEQIGVTLPPL